MKKLTLIVAGALTVMNFAVAGELLTNGDMSEGREIPAHWNLAAGAEAPLTISRSTEVYRSAPASLLVKMDGPSSGFVQQRLGGANGEVRGEVKVSGWAKLKGKIESAEIAMQVFDAAGKQLDWKVVAVLKATSDWQPFSGTAEFSGGQVVMFGLAAKGDGNIWLDDLSVTDSNGAKAAEPEVTELPVIINANDENIKYSGRFVRNDDDAVCAWPASAITIRFNGTDLNARLELGDRNRVQVVVDAKPVKILSGQKTGNLYSIVSGLSAGEHTVELVKCTEALFGNMRFLGAQLNAGGKILPALQKQRRIEVIGDSISAGYGNEASSEKEKFSPTTENAWLAYGALTARKFDADYVCVAWSGKLMWPNNTLPEIYDRVLPWQEQPLWDFRAPAPDVVLVNLSTNDFAGGNPEEEGWCKAYLVFLEQVRRNYPDAEIYCALGPMLSDPWSRSRNALSTARGYLQKIVKARQDAGDTKVRFLEFKMQDGSTGFGADWHPSLSTHRRMAEEFAAALEKDLGWRRVEKQEDKNL